MEFTSDLKDSCDWSGKGKEELKAGGNNKDSHVGWEM